MGLYPIVMTERTEIVIEGSDDLINWKPYEFKYHIGDVALAPPSVAPYQPRLDWRMRFAAIDYPEYVKWFHRFVSRLQSNSPAVVSLLRSILFPTVRHTLFGRTSIDIRSRLLSKGTKPAAGGIVLLSLVI